jgi:two-component sensor histidine kinase
MLRAPDSRTDPQRFTQGARLAARGCFSAGFGVVFGVVLAILHEQSIGVTLVYSVATSMLCWGLIDGGRLAVARWLHRDPAADASGVGREWPGWPWMIAVIAVGSTMGLTGGNSFGDFVTGERSARLLGVRTLHDAMSLLAAVLAPAVALTYFFYTRGTLAARATILQAAERQAAESRLKLLESQLEPHMLFNTLANLRVLIGVDASRAQQMLDHLISFLRATLSASRSDRQSLRAEFARTADYLALIQIRMGERLRLELDLPDALAELEVPPLLLQPLVENSVKHGLEPSVAGGVIAVRARRESDDLVLSVLDTGLGLGEGPGRPDGFGLAHVRERLATAYGTRASLRLDAAPGAGGGTLAVIRLPATPP